jgi:transposase InsO family protein
MTRSSSRGTRPLEFELRRVEHYATKAAARAGIEDCNHYRRHSSLGRVSPVDYERSLAGKEPA